MSAMFSTVFRALRLGPGRGEPPGPVMSLLSKVERVDVATIRVTGSRALGLQLAGSDWDLFVPIEPTALPTILVSSRTGSSTWVGRCTSSVCRGRRAMNDWYRVIDDGAEIRIEFLPFPNRFWPPDILRQNP